MNNKKPGKTTIKTPEYLYIVSDNEDNTVYSITSTRREARKAKNQHGNARINQFLNWGVVR